MSRICQWIEQDPTRETSLNDSCKCGRPVDGQHVYCKEHRERAYREPDSSKEDAA